MPKAYMTGNEYRKLLEALGLNVQESATFLRIHRSVVYRRIRGEVGVDFETAALLRLMVKLHITPEQVAKVVDKP